MDKQEIKNNIEVGGAILTDTAIRRLKGLQSRNNDGISSVQLDLADAICLIAANLDNFDHTNDVTKAKNVLINLAIIRDWFCEFEKP